MNIFADAWIPTDAGVLTAANALRHAKEVRWARGDWGAATIVLLHAALQTAVVLNDDRCPDRAAWLHLLDAPPADLDAWLNLHCGEHPWECATATGLVPVGALLPDSPGENAMRKASDIARWRQDVPDSLSMPEATIALVSDNLWGTRIGVGYYQGARGEEALMTLVEPCDMEAILWKRAWLNVLPRDRWAKLYAKATAPFSFPWCDPVPSSPVTVRTAHSLAVLWQMPRRWRLVEDEDGRVRQVHRQNYGLDYEDWDHPLTPYKQRSDNTWAPAKVSPHMGYKAWAGIALQARPKTRPARVVEEYIQKVWTGEPLRLRCCGWALGDSREAGAWVEETVPFYLDADARAVERAIDEAEAERHKLWGALTAVNKRFGRSADELYVRSEQAFFARVTSNNWEDWPVVLRRVSQAVYWDVMERHRLDPIAAYKAAARLRPSAAGLATEGNG